MYEAHTYGNQNRDGFERSVDCVPGNVHMIGVNGG
jgi:hypothetical protein